MMNLVPPSLPTGGTAAMPIPASLRLLTEIIPVQPVRLQPVLGIYNAESGARDETGGP